MASEPWLKFYAADYLLDAKVDTLPLEAQAILIRMWCLCHIEGSCPADVDEIARKTRLPSRVVATHQEQLAGFFEIRDGRMYSPRMEAERRKSEAARTSANRRWNKDDDADGNAKRNANGNAQSQSQSQTPPPPPQKHGFNLSLQKKEIKTDLSQVDFDARDLRKLGDAFKKIDLRLAASVGSQTSMTEKEIFEWACEEAGISIQRGLEVQKRGNTWPQTQAVGASA